MPDDRISLRQLLALLFAALLAPAIGVLPSQTAALAGEAGWLSALAALPVLLGLCWVLFALLRPAGEGAGLAQVTETVLGRGLGKGVLLLYLLWGLLLLSANARLFALRFLSTSYRNAPLGLFLLTLLGLTLWLVRKPVRVLARTGEVFYLALAIGLGFSLLLGVLQVEPRHILPLWTEDLPGVLSAAVPVLGLFGYVVFAAFLGGECHPGRGRPPPCAMVGGRLLSGAYRPSACLPGQLRARADRPHGHTLFYDGKGDRHRGHLPTGGVGHHRPLGVL